MPLFQHSERDEFNKIDVQLSIADQISSIIGSTLLLIGLPIQIPNGYLPPAKAILIIESSFFIAGSILAIIGASVTFRSRPNTLLLMCASSLSAAITFLVGCSIFLISKLLSITQEPKLIFIGNIVSIIGSLTIAVGVGCAIFADQLAIYRATPDEGKHYQIIHGLLLIGGDFYLVGAVLYIIASVVHLIDPEVFEKFGQILYCVGGGSFCTGAIFKLVSNLLKFKTTDYDKTSSLDEYETLDTKEKS